MSGNSSGDGATAVAGPSYVEVSSKTENSISLRVTYDINGGQTHTRIKKVVDGVPVEPVDFPFGSVNHTCKIENLNPDTLYQFHIFGLKNQEESVYFANISASTLPTTSLPGTPTNLNGTPTKNSIALTWSAVPSVAGYKISHGLAPNGAIIDTQQSTVPAFNLAGLASDTSYYCRVSSFNNNGNSYPLEITRKTLRVPAAPTGLKATPATSTMYVEWNWVPEPAHYAVHYGTEPGGEPASIETQEKNLTLTGLVKNTTYYIEVFASNANGWGPGSRITARTLDGPPLPPKPGTPHAVATHYDALIAWSVPGSPRYRVSLLNERFEVIASEITTYLRHTFGNLAPETKFNIEVRGVNDSGESDPSTTSFTTKAFKAPATLRRNHLDYKSVGHQWLDNIHDPQGLVYEVYLNGTLKETISERRVMLTGLTSDTRYEFKVRAQRADGYFSAFAIDSFITPLFKGWLICSPGNLKGQRRSPTTLELDWDMPYATCDICPEAVGFEISGQGITTFEVLKPPCEVKGLSADLSYELFVRAKGGGSNISGPSKVKVGPFPPKAGALEISNVMSRSATAKWAAAAKGKVAVSEYVLYINGVYIGFAKGLEHQLNELEPETSYRFEVRARAGGSGLSEPVQQTFVTEPDSQLVPNPPTNFRFKRVGLAVVLEWDPPAAGPFVTRYHITLTVAGATLTYDSFFPTITPVLLYAHYHVVIKAINAAGESLPLVGEMLVR